jgi:hypothetical protein
MAGSGTGKSRHRQKKLFLSISGKNNLVRSLVAVKFYKIIAFISEACYFSERVFLKKIHVTS